MKNYTLVIIPGWGGSHETWADFMNLLKPHFKDVVCIDLPGFGGVDTPKTVWGVEQYAEYVRRKIEKLPEGPKVIMGHSFGGQVSAYFVANNPGIAQKYILVAGAVFSSISSYSPRLLFYYRKIW
jgi:pimeloyl-ACP methyl ester carboxylesterase